MQRPDLRDQFRLNPNEEASAIPNSPEGSGGSAWRRISSASEQSGRPARWLHPVAWWVWGIGVSVAASRTTNPLILALLVAAVINVAVARRRPGPAGRSVRVFVQLGLMVIAVRMILTVVFSAAGSGREVLRLPEIPLPDWLEGIGIGGPVTSDQLLGAFYGGCRLAVVLCCFGAVNAVSSGYRLVRSLPAALHETGVAIGVAVTLAPELVVEVGRVRSARRLRGRPGGIRGLRGTVLPVLESALERSVDMAASMDVRGYGRHGATTARERRVTSLLLGGAMVALLVGVYSRLSPGVPSILGLPAVLLGVGAMVTAMWAGSRRSVRTVYGPDPWAWPEWVVSGSGVICAVAVGMGSTEALHPIVEPFTWPTLSFGSLVAVAVALVPAFAAPPTPGRVLQDSFTGQSASGPVRAHAQGSAS